LLAEVNYFLPEQLGLTYGLIALKNRSGTVSP